VWRREVEAYLKGTPCRKQVEKSSEPVLHRVWPMSAGPVLLQTEFVVGAGNGKERRGPA